MRNRTRLLTIAAILGAAAARPSPASAGGPEFTSPPKPSVVVDVGAQETYPFSLADTGRRALGLFRTNSVRVRKVIWGLFSDDLLMSIAHPTKPGHLVGAKCDLNHDEEKETVRISSCRYLEGPGWVSVKGSVKFGYGAPVPAAAVSADRRELTPMERYTRMKDRQFHEAMGFNLGI